MKGFLRSFDAWRASTQLDDPEAAVALRGALREDAKAWEENLEYSGDYWTLRKALNDNYGGAQQRFYLELMQMRRGPS